MKFIKINIKRFRSINDLTIEFKEGKPLIICGSNNVGKTNFLRALDLYFSLDKNKFDAKNDIPYDIEYGTRGSGYNTSITGWFTDENNNKYEIKTIYKKTKDRGNSLEIKAKKNKDKISETEAKNIIKKFRFLLIEASNINMPRIIAEIIDEEVLPLGLDPLRRKQTKPLEILEEFVKESKKALSGIEKEITKNLNEFIEDIPGIDKEEWKIEILFAETNKLREVLSNMIEFTLYDKNNSKMEAKGSGIQRIVLLSVIKYISDKIKDKNIIWGIDEPEAFLQPSLQKKIFYILRNVASTQQIIYTTHSHYFVDISDLDNTYLLKATYEKKEFKRRPGRVFYKVNSYIEKSQTIQEKIIDIKNHFGITRNDSWEIMPYNILVEGEEDKKYIESMCKIWDLDVPNILVAGGASKMLSYLQYLSEFSEGLSFKPKILCILDHDEEGKKEYERINKKIEKQKYKYFDLEIIHVPRCDENNCDNNCSYEIEDFIYPEIMLEAVNKFLKRKGYKKIRKKELEDRFKSAYSTSEILKFFTDKSKLINPEKKPMDFETMSIKKSICKIACDEIFSKEKFNKLDVQYPIVRKFIERISKGEDYD